MKLLFCGYLYTYSTVLHNLYLYLKLLFSSINVQMSKLIANTTFFFHKNTKANLFDCSLWAREKVERRFSSLFCFSFFFFRRKHFGEWSLTYNNNRERAFNLSTVDVEDSCALNGGHSSHFRERFLRHVWQPQISSLGCTLCHGSPIIGRLLALAKSFDDRVAG